MKNRGETFTDRLETAAKAKQAQLEKARARDPAKDPAFAARQQERAAAAHARAERDADRQAAKLAEREREAAERNARKAEEDIRQKEQAAAAAREQATKKIVDKAARDARYAARQARKK